MALTATGKDEYIALEAAIFGRELRSCGINTFIRTGYGCQQQSFQSDYRLRVVLG
ncbi:MAG: hypothetical protein K6C08_02060 [Oscillospiraceae bacterium]|nr:hypothetical protein [Oscillospiraceae bacterium]